MARSFFACIPQTPYPYNVFVLLALANTWRGDRTSLDHLFARLTCQAASHVHDLASLDIMANMMVLSAFIPATIMILRRPNEGPSPGGCSHCSSQDQGRQPSATRSSRSSYGLTEAWTQRAPLQACSSDLEGNFRASSTTPLHNRPLARDDLQVEAQAAAVGRRVGGYGRPPTMKTRCPPRSTSVARSVAGRTAIV